jgi:hypothetical protein
MINSGPDSTSLAAAALPLPGLSPHGAVGPTAAPTPATLRRGLEDDFQTRHQNAQCGARIRPAPMMPRVQNPHVATGWRKRRKPAGHQEIKLWLTKWPCCMPALRQSAEGHTELNTHVASNPGRSGHHRPDVWCMLIGPICTAEQHHGPADGLVTRLSLLPEHKRSAESECPLGTGTATHAAGDERAALPLLSHIAGARAVRQPPSECHVAGGSACRQRGKARRCERLAVA